MKDFSPENLDEVEDFIESLHQRQRDASMTRAASGHSERVFQKIWNDADDAAHDRTRVQRYEIQSLSRILRGRYSSVTKEIPLLERASSSHLRPVASMCSISFCQGAAANHG